MNKTYRKSISLLIIACLSVVIVTAQKVTRVGDLNELLLALESGSQVIELADGEYQDLCLDLKRSGSKEQPIVIKAEHPGKVIVKGNTSIVLSGNNIVLSGIDFNKGKRDKDGSLILVSGENNRLTNCRFRNYNQVTGVWVQLNGRYNRVDHCWFEGKTSGASYINVDVPKSGGNHHLVDHNYFSRPPLGKNGGSAMRIGHGSMAKRYCYTTVEFNLFEDCSGESEIMSSKSCGNTFRYNTFLNCKGALSLRQGVEGIVESNYFISNEEGKNRCGGVAVRSRKHLVVNNYFSGLAPKKGGVVSFGSASPSDPKRLAMGLIGAHFPKTAENTIAHNFFVNNRSVSIDVINDLGHRNKVFPPDSMFFFHNVMVGGTPHIKKHTESQYLGFEGNVFQGSSGINPNKGLKEMKVKLKDEEQVFTVKNSKSLPAADISTWKKNLTKGMLKRLDFDLEKVKSSGVYYSPKGKRGGLQQILQRKDVGPNWM